MTRGWNHFRMFMPLLYLINFSRDDLVKFFIMLFGHIKEREILAIVPFIVHLQSIGGMGLLLLLKTRVQTFIEF